MSAARASRFYRQAQVCASRMCGVVPGSLLAPQGETCHARWLARMCRSEVQVLRNTNHKVNKLEQTAPCEISGPRSGFAVGGSLPKSERNIPQDCNPQHLHFLIS
jgi:hypothetical protein